MLGRGNFIEARVSVTCERASEQIHFFGTETSCHKSQEEGISILMLQGIFTYEKGV